MEDKGIVTFASRIDSRFKVLVVYKDSLVYEVMKRSLSELDNSIGALLPGEGIIVIDGERVLEEGLTNNHILAIEAHEVAHELLDHSGERNEDHEDEADELAIKVLDSLGRKEASLLLRKRKSLEPETV
jgi:hypothetical protein